MLSALFGMLPDSLPVGAKREFVGSFVDTHSRFAAECR